jgi:murein DD-endopeptidase
VRAIAQLVILVAVAATPTAGRAQNRPPLVQSVDVHIPVAPTPVRIAGRRHLAYELHLTNLAATDVVLNGVDVMDAGRSARLARYRGSELAGRLGRPGVRSDLPDKRRIGGGLRAVLFVWLALDKAAPGPGRLSHRIELDAYPSSGRRRVVVEGAVTSVVARRPVALGPPVRGGPWVALYDPFMSGGHRTTIYTLDGRARIPARFAIDLVKLGSDGRGARGDRSRVANWHGHGADVLAVADAVVADARDDTPGADSIGASRGPMPIENASGNYVVLDLGGGRFAFYEHLAHRSLRVQRGDRVRRGQVIAALGNTGSSSSGPHLHFHVADASSTLAAEGLPYELTGFEVVGAYPSITAATSGKRWSPAPRGTGGTRRMELPAANVVIEFGPGR